MNKVLTTALVGGALVGAVATGGVAVAAAATSPSATTPSATSATGSTPATSTPAAGRHPKARSWWRAHREAIRTGGLDAAATAIGISPAKLRADLRGGSSVAAVATAHGVSPATVVGDLVQAADAKVNAAAGDGFLAQTRATTIEQRLPTFVTKVVNHAFAAR